MQKPVLNLDAVGNTGQHVASICETPNRLSRKAHAPRSLARTFVELEAFSVEDVHGIRRREQSGELSAPYAPRE